jgi:uncharacterized protein (DUF2237 family)
LRIFYRSFNVTLPSIRETRSDGTSWSLCEQKWREYLAVGIASLTLVADDFPFAPAS